MQGARLRTVDAFTDRPFTGNPAAVVVLEEAVPDAWMAAVARETNLSETAFVFPDELPDADFRLRWFTRGGVEVDLCGHGTLATAHCLLEDGAEGPLRFATLSGVLTVTQGAEGSLAMDLPASHPRPIDPPEGIADALGASVDWTGLSDSGYLVARLADEEGVRDLRPNLTRLAELPPAVVVPTASADSGHDYDFVSRVFAPRVGIDEDPVTGGAHAVLAPYWAAELGRSSLVGFQASARSGLVGVELRGERAIISGQAVTVLDGILRAS